MSETEKFFVYGTLKVGCYFADQFDKFRVSCLPGHIENHALYDLGWFPCVKSKDGATAYGELHEYKHPDIVMRAFDRIEGYTGNPDIDLYTRKKVTVYTDAGEFEAYIYEFTQSIPDRAKEIEAGEWKESKVRS